MGARALSVKKLFSSKPKREANDKLTIYTISQLFNQLVCFKELVLSMYAFVGREQTSKVDAIFNCVRQVIDSMLQTIMIDRHDYELQVNRITEGLGKLDITVDELTVKSLYPRLIKLDLVINSPPTELTILGIQTVLEGIINEPLRLVLEKAKGRQTKIKVYSSNFYKVNYGVSYVGKDGNKISGDSYVFEDFSNGQTCIALSDGMGKGEKAHEESTQALNIFKALLTFNFSVTDAIQTLQALKSSANYNERFFSLDVCMIDRERKKVAFYKKGATPTFIVRGDTITEIKLEQLPVGVMIDQEIDHVSVDLCEDDLIIMCSDGIFEQYTHVEELKSVIMAHKHEQPKLFSKLLLQLTIEKSRGKVKDDMMVVAVVYKKHLSLAS